MKDNPKMWDEPKNTLDKILDDLDESILYGEGVTLDYYHSKADLKQDLEALIQTEIVKARIDELVKFKERLDSNHHDMPIGTCNQYVTEQMLNRLTALKEELKGCIHLYDVDECPWCKGEM
jgi:hypothetical protein